MINSLTTLTSTSIGLPSRSYALGAIFVRKEPLQRRHALESMHVLLIDRLGKVEAKGATSSDNSSIVYHVGLRVESGGAMDMSLMTIVLNQLLVGQYWARCCIVTARVCIRA